MKFNLDFGQKYQQPIDKLLQTLIMCETQWKFPSSTLKKKKKKKLTDFEFNKKKIKYFRL